MTTAELIRRGARQHGSRTAILCGDERLTFTEVDELSNRIGNVLLARGLDRVGLLLDNGLYSIPVDFAVGILRAARPNGRFVQDDTIFLHPTKDHGANATVA